MFSIRPLPRVDQQRRQQSHVAGEADDLDPRVAQRGIDLRLMRGPIAAEGR
jgi:hypothetical protein